MQAPGQGPGQGKGRGKGLCASALAYRIFFHSGSALLNPKRFKLISAFSFPLLLPFTRRLIRKLRAGRGRLKIFMTNDVYRIKQCGTLPSPN
jgi:hypothetical protein